MFHLTLKTISNEEAKELVSTFSNKNNVINIEENDITELYNDNGIILVETGLLNEPEQITYDTNFKCCLIEEPENLSLTEVQKIVDLFPSKKTVFGLKCCSSFTKTQFLLKQ